MQQDASSLEVSCDWTRVLLGDGHGLVAMAVTGGAVVEANSNAAALFGRPVVGATLAELFDPCSRTKLWASLASCGPCELQVAGGAEPRAARFLVLPAPAGQRLLVAPHCAQPAYSELQGRELLRLNDELARFTREMARRAQDLAEAHAKLKTLDALRQQFMEMLAHDLKSPLSAIRLTAGALARQPEEPPADAVRLAAHRIDRTVLRMTTLIDVVLAAARLESEEPALSRSPCCFEALAREALDGIEPLARERSVMLACEAHGDVTAVVDATWMRQVLANLLDNAIRYAPEQSTVSVSVVGDDARVCCDVADHGPGVPPELRAAVFERFRQTGSRRGSAGLGLWVARRLVELHGGRIWIEDAEGGGAKFRFEVSKEGAPVRQPGR